MKRASFKHSQDSTGRDLGDYVWFICPACDEYHRARVRMPNEPTPEELQDLKDNKHGLWTWNGSEEFPTIRASILLPHSGCHLFITDGKIQYCQDSKHALAGQTVDLPEIDL